LVQDFVHPVVVTLVVFFIALWTSLLAERSDFEEYWGNRMLLREITAFSIS